MATNQTNGSGELRFVDPSVDPSIFWDITKFLTEVGSGHLIIKSASEILRRFPAVEYAVGFDGIDDWVCIDNLDIDRKGIDVETKLWISQDNQGCEIIDILDSDDNSILTLAGTTNERLEIRVIHKNNGDTQNTVLSKIEPETWQDLRVWSDGNIFSIEVNGTQISIIPDIILENGPFKFYFGTGRRFRYFRGMIKSLQVQSGTNQLFDLQGGEGLKIENNTNSADIAGTHSMRKGRFRKEFRE